MIDHLTQFKTQSLSQNSVCLHCWEVYYTNTYRQDLLSFKQKTCGYTNQISNANNPAVNAYTYRNESLNLHQQLIKYSSLSPSSTNQFEWPFLSIKSITLLNGKLQFKQLIIKRQPLGIAYSLNHQKSLTSVKERSLNGKCKFH